MRDVNLLPWREEVRAQQQKNFKRSLISCAFLTLMAIMLFHLYLSLRIKNEFALLRDDNKKLTQLCAKTNLVKEWNKQKNQYESALTIINVLKQNEKNNISILNKIINAQAENIMFSSVVKKGNSIHLCASASSTCSLAHFNADMNVLPATHINNIRSNSNRLDFQIEARENAQSILEISQ